jgi:uncharacterized protein YndB with AHSA1/START domain
MSWIQDDEGLVLTEPIELERRMRAPAARVWSALHEPADLARWAWGSLGREVRAEVDFRVGGAFTISTLRGDGARWAMLGEYMAIEPGSLVAHTLRWDAPMGYGPVDERVAIELAADGAATVVRFRHEGDFGDGARAEHVEGWGNVLDMLTRVVEGRTKD